MASDGYRVVGDDGDLYAGEPGTTQVGDAIKTLDELAGGAAASGAGAGEWLITKKAAAGSIFGSIPVGAVFPADGDEVPAVGDECALLAFEQVADLSSWDAKISAKEIDTTVLKDKFTKYGVGKADFSGSIKGQYTIGETDKAGGFLNRFFDIVKKTAAGVISYTPKANLPLYIKGFIRESSLPGETQEFMFAMVNLFGFNLGAVSGNAQTFESSMRLAADDPTFYSIDN